jgi:hypothetical protein
MLLLLLEDVACFSEEVEATFLVSDPLADLSSDF